MERQRGLDPGGVELLERAPCPRDARARSGATTRTWPERVVMPRDGQPLLHAGVHPDPWPGRSRQRARIPGRGAKPRGGILGADAQLDGMDGRLQRRSGGGEDLLGEGLAGRDPDLLPDEVQTGHQLGHPVLHLKPGVHLEEPDLPIWREQELGGGRIPQSDSLRDGHRQRMQPTPLIEAKSWRGRLLDQFLMTALGRAIPLAQGDHGPVRIAQELHLHVPRAQRVPLQVDLGRPERALRLDGRRVDRVHECRGIVHPAHAPSTSACGGLHQEWIADVIGGSHEARLRARPTDLDGVERAGQDGDTSGTRRAPGRELVTEPARSRARPDEGDARPLDRLGERRLLRQEAVSGVDRVDRHGACHVHDHVAPEVALRRGRRPDAPGGIRARTNGASVSASL